MAGTIRCRFNTASKKQRLKGSLPSHTSIYPENMFSEARNVHISGGAFSVQMFGTTIGMIMRYQREICN